MGSAAFGRGTRAPGLPPCAHGMAAAAGAASVLAHALLLAAVLRPATSAPPATAGHRNGWPAVAVMLAAPPGTTPLDPSLPTPVATVPVSLRRAPALPQLALPELPSLPAASQADRLPASTQAPRSPEASPGASPGGWASTPAGPAGWAAMPAQASQRLAHLQAVRAAQDRLAEELRALAPAARECREVARQQLACDEDASALPEALQARLLFQAAQSRALGLSGDRLEILLGEGRVLAVSLHSP